MRTVMVRYKTKPDKADENVQYIQRVFEELQRNNPVGLHYASFRFGDGVSFMHIATIETTDGNNPLTQSAAFKAFQAGIKDRCEEQPAVTELTAIGSYHF